MNIDRLIPLTVLGFLILVFGWVTGMAVSDGAISAVVLFGFFTLISIMYFYKTYKEED